MAHASGIGKEPMSSGHSVTGLRSALPADWRQSHGQSRAPRRGLVIRIAHGKVEPIPPGHGVTRLQTGTNPAALRIIQVSKTSREFAIFQPRRCMLLTPLNPELAVTAVEEDPLAVLDEIERLKREKDAVLLAHFYVGGEIQDIAYFAADSLQP